MRERAPFHADDLAELDDLFLSQATAVVAMQEVHAGNHAPSVIGLRHDVDASKEATRHALNTAVKMAEWEADRGYRASYYILHTAPYWREPGFRGKLERIATLGHEIGIHNNALAEALRTGGDPYLILESAIEELRSFGFQVRGTAGHGDPFCNRDRQPGEVTFANDEIFVECARPQEGLPDRKITRGNITLRLRPRPLADFGLDYDALWLGMQLPFRCSDSGGRWLNPGFEESADRFRIMRGASAADGLNDPRTFRQLHLLIHPDWWQHAFASVLVAA